MGLIKKLSMAKSELAKSLNEIPIRWGKYINHDIQEQKVIFIGHEKAIYDSEGNQLDGKLRSMNNNISEIENSIRNIDDSLSDEFSEETSYGVGDYCIYQNRLYRFTEAHAGPWNGEKVVPVSLSAELVEAAQGLRQGISAVEGNLLFATNKGDVHDVDLNNYTENGIYFYTYSSAPTIQNSPFSNIGATFLVLNFPSNETYQIAADRTASELDKIAIRHYLDTGWSDWVYLVTNTDLQAKLLGTSNLNDVKSPGTYAQTHSSNATTGRNYPAEDAGFLEVIFARTDFIFQKYNAYSSGAVYKRTFSISGWNEWKQV